MRRTPGALLLSLTLAATPAAAQLSGYVVPGSLGQKRLTAKEQVTRSYQDARWKVGFLQLDPRLAITDLGYVSNIYSTSDAEAESDFKAQGAAGLRGFFNLGPKVLVSPFANLGYTWWQDQEELRSVDESFGIQLFGDFNRLQLQLQGGRVEAQRNLSSELEVPVDVRTDRLQVDLDIDFWGPFRFFASAVDNQVRQSGTAAEERLPGLDLSLLDVDGEMLKGGFAYELGSGLSLGVGWEETESLYLNDPTGRSNKGSGPLVRIGFEGTRAALDVEVAQRDLEFAGRAGGETRDQLIGLGQLSWQFTEKLTAGIYSATRLEASALESTALFEGRRSGLSLRRQNAGRGQVSLFFEVGEDEFSTVASDDVTRIDDFSSFGINYRFQMGQRLTLEIGYLDTRRESSDPEFDRDLRAITSRVRLGGDLLPW